MILHNPRSCHLLSIVLPACLISMALVAALGSGKAIAQTAESAQSGESTVQPAAQSLLYVNPVTGNDQSEGSAAAPLRTITHALQIAQPQTVILLAAGTYSSETGEVFPLVMKPSVTIQGDPTIAGRGFLIQGGGLFLSPTSAGQNIAILGANQAVLVGVTVTNSNPRGYGLWVESSDPIILSNTLTGNGHDGISTVGSSAPLIQGNLFVRNGANGITIFGNSRPQVRENVFEQTGFGINISDHAAPLISDNRISQNRVGVVVQKNARPTLRGNLIEGSREDGIAAIAQAQPDLGTAAEPGNNIFINNARYDINASADRQIVPAFGNQLSHRITGQVDLAATEPSAEPVMVASVADRLPLSTLVLINQLPPAASNPAPLTPVGAGAAIDIPVPAPESFEQSTVQAVADRRLPALPNASTDLLPVPSGEVPVGNVGDLPTVGVSSLQESSNAFRPPADLRYRVVVEANGDRVQALVKSIVPNAFLTREQGRSLMQVGAFSSRDNAEAAVQLLNRNGLRAVIENMD